MEQQESQETHTTTTSKDILDKDAEMFIRYTQKIEKLFETLGKYKVKEFQDSDIKVTFNDSSFDTVKEIYLPNPIQNEIKEKEEKKEEPFHPFWSKA